MLGVFGGLLSWFHGDSTGVWTHVKALMWGMYTYCRARMCTSYSESKVPFISRNWNKSLYSAELTLLASAQSLSIRWLWTLLPAMKLPLSDPRLVIMYVATSTFSIPWSPRTLEGSPNSCTPYSKYWSTILALLSVQHFRYTMALLYPSMQQCITSLHKIRMCHRWFGPATLYVLRQIAYRHLTPLTIPSIRFKLSLMLNL